MSIKKNIIRAAKGFLWRIENGQRANVGSLDEGLEHLADCGCGQKCCPGNEAVNLPAQDTGTKYSLIITGGNLIIKNNSTDATSVVVALP